MFIEIALAVWTGTGLLWWMLAWSLVAADQRKVSATEDTTPRRLLSVFKPLPPLRLKGIEVLAAGLESFMAQLDAESEMLLGIHEADRDATAHLVDQLRANHPKARLKVIYRGGPDEAANPKIAWQRILARHAEGELWLWSDADIIAPAGFLRSARNEFERGTATMLTFPYVIREIPRPPALLEALFVNVEFYPGVLLLRKMGPVDFGLGAAMLFQRDDFLREVDWDELGASLADDFLLGQKLRPVGVGATTLATVADAPTWQKAIQHDLRWAKTIWWNRPIGSAARILIMPVLGWAGYVAWHPFHFFAWMGLLGMVQADVFFAGVICRTAGCRLGWGDGVGLEFWSLWRLVLWLLCWLPGPVVWSEKIWRGPMEYDQIINPEQS